jgi:hypothetical protein
VLILPIRISAGGEQHLHQVDIAARGRNQQRCRAVDRRRVDRHALVEKCASRREVVQTGSHRKLSSSGGVGRAYRGDLGKQQGERVVVRKVDRPHPGSETLTVSLIGVFAGVEQLPDTGRISVQQRSRKWRYGPGLGRICRRRLADCGVEIPGEQHEDEQHDAQAHGDLRIKASCRNAGNRCEK